MCSGPQEQGVWGGQWHSRDSSEVFGHFSKDLGRALAFPLHSKLPHFLPSFFAIANKRLRSLWGQCCCDLPILKETQLDQPIPFAQGKRHDTSLDCRGGVKSPSSLFDFLLLRLRMGKYFLIKILFLTCQLFYYLFIPRQECRPRAGFDSQYY